MQTKVRTAGYAALLVAPAALLAAAVAAAAGHPTADGLPLRQVGLGSGVVLAGGLAAVRERRHAFERPDGPAFDRRDALTVLAVVAGALVTHALSVAVGLGPVLASALVGLAVGAAAPAVAVPAYCGSFVGMAGPDLFPGAEHVGVAGLVAGVAFVAADGVFDGFGGKLGTLAFFGVAAALLLPGGSYAAGSGPAWTLAAVTVPVAVAAVLATALLHLRLGLGAVVGSAAVGAVAAAGLPPLLPDLGGTLAAVAFCASFAGMSSTRRLAGAREFAAAGAVSGLVFVAVAPAFVGAGGKLGTVAFLSCLTTAGGRAAYDRVAAAVRSR